MITTILENFEGLKNQILVAIGNKNGFFVDPFHLSFSKIGAVAYGVADGCLLLEIEGSLEQHPIAELSLDDLMQVAMQTPWMLNERRKLDPY